MAFGLALVAVLCASNSARAACGDHVRATATENATPLSKALAEKHRPCQGPACREAPKGDETPVTVPVSQTNPTNDLLLAVSHDRPDSPPVTPTTDPTTSQARHLGQDLLDPPR